MFDRRLLQYFDWGMLGLAVTIGCCGLLVLYSAVTAETPHPQKIIFYKQLIWFSGALIAMVASFSVNYKLLDRWGHVNLYRVHYSAAVGAFFRQIRRRFKALAGPGPLSLQPSELAKIAVMIALARYYSKDANTRGFTLRELFKPAVLTLIPFVLIVKQPDLGTAGLILLIAGSITLFVKDRAAVPDYPDGVLCGNCAAGLVFPKRIPEAADTCFFRPGSGSAGCRISYHSIQNSDRFGHDLRQRVFKGHSECVILSAGRAHRFHIFRSGRRMGFHWIGYHRTSVSDVDILGSQYRPSDAGSRSGLFWRWG